MSLASVQSEQPQAFNSFPGRYEHSQEQAKFGKAVHMPEAATAMRSPGLKRLCLTMVSWTSPSKAA